MKRETETKVRAEQLVKQQAQSLERAFQFIGRLAHPRGVAPELLYLPKHGGRVSHEHHNVVRGVDRVALRPHWFRWK